MTLIYHLLAGALIGSLTGRMLEIWLAIPVAFLLCLWVWYSAYLYDELAIRMPHRSRAYRLYGAFMGPPTIVLWTLQKSLRDIIRGSKP